MLKNKQIQKIFVASVLSVGVVSGFALTAVNAEDNEIQNGAVETHSGKIEVKAVPTPSSEEVEVMEIEIEENEIINVMEHVKNAGVDTKKVEQVVVEEEVIEQGNDITSSEGIEAVMENAEKAAKVLAGIAIAESLNEEVKEVKEEPKDDFNLLLYGSIGLVALFAFTWLLLRRK